MWPNGIRLWGLPYGRCGIQQGNRFTDIDGVSHDTDPERFVRRANL
jgi:hypothetical protein